MPLCMKNNRLLQTFYAQDTRQVAHKLLGKLLVRQSRDKRLSGFIVETEAYRGFDDTASHAHKGRTKRCAVMFGEAGHAYVYLTYGIHHMFNIVTESADFPSAVLIRAIQPLEGIKYMLRNRNITKDISNIGSGPGKVSQAMLIDRTLNGENIFAGGKIWVEEYDHRQFGGLGMFSIDSSSRVGIDYADSKSRNHKWRYFIKGNGCVSR